MKRSLSGLARAAVLLSLLFSGCGDGGNDPDSRSSSETKPIVYASIAPLAGLAEKIAGDEIEVRALVGENQDPHDFSPTPKQLVSLANSSLFLTTGMPFEDTLIDKLVSGPGSPRIVDLTEDIELHEFDEHDHHHHEGHDHDHGEYDPHIWLSPPLLAKQVLQIVEVFAAILPESEESFRDRGRETEGQINALHARLTEKLAEFRGQRFYVYHGAFAYFADAYGLEQEAIETGGRKPEQKQIYSLIESAKKEQIRVILVQPQFDPESAETIAEAIGGKVVSIDPMASDVLRNLDNLAEAISAMRSGE